MRKLVLAILFGFFRVLACAEVAGSGSVNIYIDADFSNHFESSQSIERGLSVALARVDNTLFGRPVKLVRKDHRGNSARSLRHIRQYLEDPDALLIVSGIHSPPLLSHRDFINENGVLVLVPWAAAGPITRYPAKNNSIFRLSIDDTKAGQVLASFAIDVKGYKRPFLMLERTGWGRSNERTIRAALSNLGVNNASIGWFDWNLKEAGARALVEDAFAARSDSILLVGNAIEGITIAKMLALQPNNRRLPVVSHWGITGGRFHEEVSHDLRKAIDLHFIQTRFSFLGRELDAYETEVLDSAKRLFPSIESPLDVLAPTGFIHAYDLGLLLNQAASQVPSSVSIEEARLLLRAEFENIQEPVRGLIKIYENPFSEFAEENPDAHEALDMADFVMGYFGEQNEIILHDWRSD